ncbi:ABC transporter substrate-binding protein [Acrocarpospora sp. B8E8]|uniref:ABC transporter substrate-binding protein n=1 Tax=Acrocarpospora sp. B8E8 TaxID=3153572 RepID=UPI00325CD4E4
MNSRRAKALAAAMTLVAMLATACSGSSSAGKDKNDLSLIVPLTPALWDTRQTASTLLAAQLLVNEPLMAYQQNGSLVPNLAEEVSHPSATVYEYTLRPGVKFSDGTPLTAEDVKFSYELHSAKDSPSYSAAYWARVKSIETSGDDKVTITLMAPDPQFQYTIAKTGIVSKAYYDKNGDKVGTPDVPNIGTGPYAFSRFVPQSETTLTASPGYRGKRPPYAKITMKTAKDDAARVLALQSGEADGVLNAPLSQIDSFEKLDGFSGQEAPDLAYYRVNFDMKKAPFDDVHVRRAITHAIDRKALAEGVFGNRAELAPTMVPESIMAAVGDAAEVKKAYEGFAAGLTFDLDAARAELKQSNSPDGFEVEVPVTQGDPNQSLIVQTMAQDLAKIGITLHVKSLDEQGFGDAVYFKHTADGLSVDSWNGGTPDPINIPRNTLTPGLFGNASQYDNSRVSALLADYQKKATDDPSRVTMLLQALAITAEDAAVVPLFTPKVYAFMADGMTLKGFDTFWYMTRWIDNITTSS